MALIDRLNHPKKQKKNKNEILIVERKKNPRSFFVGLSLTSVTPYFNGNIREAGKRKSRLYFDFFRGH